MLHSYWAPSSRPRPFPILSQPPHPLPAGQWLPRAVSYSRDPSPLPLSWGHRSVSPSKARRHTRWQPPAPSTAARPARLLLTAAGMRPCLSGGPRKPAECAPSLVGDINIFQHAGDNLIGAFPRVPSSRLETAEAKRKNSPFANEVWLLPSLKRLTPPVSRFLVYSRPHP